MNVDLVSQTRKAFGHAQYLNSHVSLGAGLSTNVGVITSGPMQNCAYPNSICALRAAVVAAIARGAEEINEVAMHCPGGSICGCCVEMLRAFVKPSTSVHLFDSLEGEGKTVTVPASKLAPNAFETSDYPTSSFLTGDWKEPGITTFVDTLQLPPAEECNDDMLSKLAISACSRCYVPVSHFPVGAAMLYINKAGEKSVAVAANIEHPVVLGLGLCAERSCLCAANSKDGIKKVLKLAVCCAHLPEPGRPCGGCRQSLVEYGDYPVLQLQLDKENKSYLVEPTTSVGLLPGAFLPSSLEN